MDRHIDLTEQSDFESESDRIQDSFRGMETLERFFPGITEDDLLQVFHESNLVFTGNKEERLRTAASFLYEGSFTCDRCGHPFNRIPYRRVWQYNLCQECYEDWIFGKPIWARFGWEGHPSDGVFEMLRQAVFRSWHDFTHGFARWPQSLMSPYEFRRMPIDF